VEDLIETISAYGELRRDELLSYICDLSARADGPWNSDDQRLGGLLTERSLEALGHIDVTFDRSPAAAFATPRLLIARLSEEPIAFLVGQRTRKVVEQVMEMDSCETVTVDRAASPPGFPCVPGRIQVTASTREEMAEIAGKIGARYISEPPAKTLIDFSATFDDYVGGLSWCADPDLNWAKRTYDKGILAFSGVRSVPGMQLIEFRQTPLRPARYRLRDGQRTADVQRDWGRYAVLAAAKIPVLGFDDYAPGTRSGHFITPLGALLPRTFARAASLCSGYPPFFIRRGAVRVNLPERVGFLVYPDVNKDVAAAIAAKLGQHLQNAKITDMGGIHV
jgi:hypothetical protein